MMGLSVLAAGVVVFGDTDTGLLFDASPAFM